MLLTTTFVIYLSIIAHFFLGGGGAEAGTCIKIEKMFQGSVKK